MIYLNKTFQRAARSALVFWKGDFSDDGDLVNNLWLWYLESPSVQKKIDKGDRALVQTLVRRRALQILAKESHDDNVFHGTNPYNPEAVKDALMGISTNKYLVDILPMAMDRLSDRNEGYAEAIRVRYDDDIIPARQSSEQVYLSRAVAALTDKVNDITYAAGVDIDAEGNLVVEDGPGSRDAVFPDVRKSRGDGHSDPTANIAILLIEHPELRDEYLYETPLPEILRGKAGVAA